MEGPRPPQENEWPTVMDFLNQQLRPKLGWSIALEYPTALVLNNRPNVRIITDQNKVISHAVLKPLILKTPTSILKMAAVGSVVTDSSYRNQGLASQLILDCLIEAKKQDCDLAILWTDKHDYYRKLNFELAGFEESFLIQDEFAPEVQNLKFMKTNLVSPEAILRLYNQHTVTTFRTTEDIRKFLQIPQTHLYTAWDAAGQLVAYAAEGKGVDLTGYIHEWGGNVSKLLALLAHIRKDQQRPITVMVPHHAVNMIAGLKKAKAVQHTGYLGMLKIVCPEQMLSKLNKATRLVGVNDLFFKKLGDGYAIEFGSRTLELPDEKDFLKVVFGPITEIQGLNEQEQKKLDRILPLPLWIWGWDSV